MKIIQILIRIFNSFWRRRQVCIRDWVICFGRILEIRNYGGRVSEWFCMLYFFFGVLVDGVVISWGFIRYYSREKGIVRRFVQFLQCLFGYSVYGFCLRVVSKGFIRVSFFGLGQGDGVEVFYGRVLRVGYKNAVCRLGELIGLDGGQDNKCL